MRNPSAEALSCGQSAPASPTMDRGTATPMRAAEDRSFHVTSDLEVPRVNPSVAELRAAAPTTPPVVPVADSPGARAAFWRTAGMSVVYVIQGAPNTPVKIGTARDVMARLKTLQTGSFHTLHLIDVMPGSHRIENRLHRGLEGDRMRGEWFWGEATRRFLKALHDHAVAAVEHYQRTEQVLPPPQAVLTPPRAVKNSRGMKSSDFGSNALGHRWRTASRLKSPVKVSFTTPGTDFKPR